MNIQKYSKVFAFIFVFFTLAQAFNLKAPSGGEEKIGHSDLEFSQIRQVKIDDPKRFLQAVGVSSSTGVVMNPINNTRFSGLTVYHEIPTNWVIGEVFQVRGRLNTPATGDQTYVIFAFISSSSSSKYTFRTTVAGGSSEFTLVVNTKSMQVGDYYLAFYPGLSGSYSMSTVYSVRYPGSENAYAMPPAAPTGCSLNFENNKLILRWNEDGLTPLEKIVFSQGSQNVEYILSNFQSSFEVPFRDFAAFSSGYVTVTIASAYSSQNSAGGRISAFSPYPWSFVFRAGPHTYVNEYLGIDLVTPLPQRVAVGSTVRIQGTTSAQTYNEAVIEEPQKVVTRMKLINSNDKYLNAGTYFDISLVLNNEGIYIVEINTSQGQALAWRPIYVGDFYPLLPDLVDSAPDLTNDQIINSQPQGLETLRNALLFLINKKRQEWGRGALTLDNDLNNLAYGHSYDMMSRNFFAHANPQGDRVQERATKAGLYYPVSENIGMGLDLQQVQFRLSKSPGHLANIINENSTRVGLGIARGSDGYLYVTENYAGPLQTASSTSNTYQNPTPTYQNPAPTPTSTQTSTSSSSTSTQTQPIQTNSGSSISASQIQSLRIQIRNWISNAYPTSVQDPVLSNIVKNWLNSGMSQSIFDYTWDVNNYPTTGLSASSVNGPYDVNITSYFVVGSHFAQPDSTYTKFGVGVLLLADNSLKIQVEYAQ